MSKKQASKEVEDIRKTGHNIAVAIDHGDLFNPEVARRAEVIVSQLSLSECAIFIMSRTFEVETAYHDAVFDLVGMDDHKCSKAERDRIWAFAEAAFALGVAAGKKLGSAR